MPETLTIDQVKEMIEKAVGAQFAATQKANEEAGRKLLEADPVAAAKAATSAGLPEGLGSQLGDAIGKAMALQTDTRDKAPEKGMRCARLIRALAAGKADPVRAKAFAEENWKDPLGVEVTKALAAGQGSAGGFMVPEDYVDEVIELLRNRTAVRRLGAITVPMPHGTLTYPKQTGGATAEYVGENAGQNASQPTLGSIVFSAKKLRVTVPISNDLLIYSRPSADTLVRNDMLRQTSIKEDLSFIRGAGTNFSPKGLYFQAASDNKFDANGTVNLANVTTDLGKAILKLEENNVAFSKPGWIMAPRTRNYLMTVRDGNGNYAFRAEMLLGTLWGFPFVSTNQILKTYGSGSNESEVYLADFDDVLIAESSDMTIDTSTEAAYLNSDGTLVSAFANDQTVLRAIMRHDLGVRHEESIAVIEAVKWGV